MEIFVQQLVNELKTPRAHGKGPTMLDLRAAKAIETLYGINQTNALCIRDMQKNIDHLQGIIDESTTISPKFDAADDTTIDPRQGTLF